MAAGQDTMKYFQVRARGEAIRMVYALAGKPLNEETISFDDWAKIKPDQPLGQLPVFTCPDGELVMSNSIARYAAKKFGMSGSCLWEETLNDMIVETCLDCSNELPGKVYMWKVFKRVPEPENSAEVVQELKEKIIRAMNYIQKVAEKRGKKFLVSDKISLADIWLFCTLEFSGGAFDDSMELTPWVKEFVAKFKSDERVVKYIAGRGKSVLGL